MARTTADKKRERRFLKVVAFGYAAVFLSVGAADMMMGPEEDGSVPPEAVAFVEAEAEAGE